MNNDEIMFLRLKRVDVINLLSACADAYIITTENDKKYLELYDNIRNQLKEFDDLLTVEQPLPFN